MTRLAVADVLEDVPIYRVGSHWSAPAFALLNAVAMDFAQSDEIVPFFAALAASPAACFATLIPLRISLLAFFFPLVPAA